MWSARGGGACMRALVRQPPERLRRWWPCTALAHAEPQQGRLELVVAPGCSHLGDAAGDRRKYVSLGKRLTWADATLELRGGREVPVARRLLHEVLVGLAVVSHQTKVDVILHPVLQRRLLIDVRHE